MRRRRVKEVRSDPSLLKAVEEGDLETVNCLLDNPKIARKVAGKDPLGQNAAFRIAAKKGHLNILERLVKEKSVFENVYACDWGSANAPLRWAVEEGHYKVVHFLLQFEKVKKNITVQDSAGIPHIIIKISVENRFFNITYLLINACKQLKLDSREDVLVDYKSLEDFFKEYDKRLAEAPFINTMLFQFLSLPFVVTSIISDYDETLSLASILKNK